MAENRYSFSEKFLSVLNHAFLIAVGLSCLVPFLFVVTVSLSSENSLAHYGATLIPREFSIDAFRFISSFGVRIMTAYKNTLFISIVGTVIGMVVITGVAYPMSKKQLPFREAFMKYVLFSMLFGGGLIPFYIVIRTLGIYNTYWALILPAAYNSWFMILMRNYFMSIPPSLEESALLDGANEIQILVRIIIPVSRPIIATIALFLIVGHWGSWYHALLFLDDNNKWPIMMFLRDIINSTRTADRLIGSNLPTYPPSQSLKMAVVVVCTLPILFAYPFAQKHFIKGIMIGSIKG